MAWKYLNKNPLGKHTGDCVVRAIAFATNKSWGETYMNLTDWGYDRAEMPSWNACWWSFLKALGFKRHIIDDGCSDCYTLEDFCYEHPYGTYIIFIPSSMDNAGHVVAIRDGNIYDTWDSSMEIPLAYWEKGEK